MQEDGKVDGDGEVVDAGGEEEEVVQGDEHGGVEVDARIVQHELRVVGRLPHEACIVVDHALQQVKAEVRG